MEKELIIFLFLIVPFTIALFGSSIKKPKQKSELTGTNKPTWQEISAIKERGGAICAGGCGRIVPAQEAIITLSDERYRKVLCEEHRKQQVIQK